MSDEDRWWVMSMIVSTASLVVAAVSLLIALYAAFK